MWRLRTDIEKTCRYDVPIACALYELDAIKKKRAPTAVATRRAASAANDSALKLALRDLGTGYVTVQPDGRGRHRERDDALQGTDSVRRIP